MSPWYIPHITLVPCSYRSPLVAVCALTADEQICKIPKYNDGLIPSTSSMVEHIMHFDLCYASAWQVAELQPSQQRDDDDSICEPPDM